jgi:indole-3-glycerol phosphate synthase
MRTNERCDFPEEDGGLAGFEMSTEKNILDTIVEEKQREVARLPMQAVYASEIRAALDARGGVRDFMAALTRPGSEAVALIAEVKKASPSKGLICPDFDPVRIAATYEAVGASCLSVLTDEKFFQGSLEYLKSIRQAVNLPLLRKDFIIDERQILEAAVWGADAILLIVAILDDERLAHFHALADASGLTALVEVHDELELERALRCGARLIGVNNRDLKTFNVDLGTTERLARMLWQVDPERRSLLVAESGIHERADVLRLHAAGARAILVGESLMRSGDITSKARQLLGT